jgi:enoyl-[acyl-carrier protein] reductase/trans-2-enoyl-CoA reductase (NAD+)
MTQRPINPTARGFLYLDSHPTGCERIVVDQWAQVPPSSGGVLDGRRPVALIVGSSAGYGLAATIAGLARYGIKGIGVCFEKPPARRTATAGWYRTIATATLAEKAGSTFEFVNADAYSDDTKTLVLDALEQNFGPVDYLVYSLASPRRTDPDTGMMHSSVIKPIGSDYRTKTLVFDDDRVPQLREIEVAAAQGPEIEDTVKVMGGEDWARWIDALAARRLLADGMQTVALSYIGSDLTSAIYRRGSIGAAKAHLEATATTLNTCLLEVCGGSAVTSVNGAAVTQSSTAIPGIALYVSLLHSVLGDQMQTPLEQFTDLWDHLTGTARLDLDEQGRIRLDCWELTDAVQAEIIERWHAATPENITELADTDWFTAEVRRLYGFDVPGVDYTAPTEPDLPWPATAATAIAP